MALMMKGSLPYMMMDKHYEALKDKKAEKQLQHPFKGSNKCSNMIVEFWS